METLNRQAIGWGNKGSAGGRGNKGESDGPADVCRFGVRGEEEADEAGEVAGAEGGIDSLGALGRAPPPVLPPSGAGAERAAKSELRAKVEHPFLHVQRRFGYAKAPIAAWPRTGSGSACCWVSPICCSPGATRRPEAGNTAAVRPRRRRAAGAGSQLTEFRRKIRGNPATTAPHRQHPPAKAPPPIQTFPNACRTAPAPGSAAR